MAVQVQDSKWFDYMAEKTEIADNAVPGATKIGGIIYFTDTGGYSVIRPDGTLADFSQPVVAV
jgi:hypothetical protein